MSKYLISTLLLAFALSTGLFAQQPRQFCDVANDCPDGVNCCSDDLLKVRFQNEAGDILGHEMEANVGETVKLVVTMDVTTVNIQGFSYAIKHDDNFLTIVDVVDTDAEYLAAFDQGFKILGSAFGGPDADIPDQGFGHGVALSFVLPKVLPVKNDLTLAFATYTVASAIPEGSSTQLLFVDEELATFMGGQAVALNYTVEGNSILPNTIIDAAVLGPPAAAECPKYGFFFGSDTLVNNVVVPDGVNTLSVHTRNELAASAFELAVRNNNNNLSFVSDQIGDNVDNLRELIITDENAMSHTDDLTLNTATIPDTPITNITRGTATSEDSSVTDFFAFQLNPLEGGSGFFVGYIADLTPDQLKVLPATGAGNPCPLNEILVITLGGDPTPPTMAGDADGNSRINVTDAVLIVRRLFGIGQELFDCESIYDINRNNQLGIDDAMFLLNWLFRRGPKPEEPFFNCGVDAGTTLGCNQPNCS